MFTKGCFNIYVKLPKSVQQFYSMHPDVSGDELYQIFKEYLTRDRSPLGMVPAIRKVAQHKKRKPWIVYRRGNTTNEYRIVR